MPSSILTVFLIVRFPMTETRPVHGKLDYHVSAGRKRDGYQQLPVSVELTKYGNTFFRPVILIRYRFTNERETASYILFSAKNLLFLFSFNRRSENWAEVTSRTSRGKPIMPIVVFAH